MENQQEIVVEEIKPKSNKYLWIIPVVFVIPLVILTTALIIIKFNQPANTASLQTSSTAAITPTVPDQIVFFSPSKTKKIVYTKVGDVKIVGESGQSILIDNMVKDDKPIDVYSSWYESLERVWGTPTPEWSPDEKLVTVMGLGLVSVDSGGILVNSGYDYQFSTNNQLFYLEYNFKNTKEGNPEKCGYKLFSALYENGSLSSKLVSSRLDDGCIGGESISAVSPDNRYVILGLSNDATDRRIVFIVDLIKEKKIKLPVGIDHLVLPNYIWREPILEFSIPVPNPEFDPGYLFDENEKIITKQVCVDISRNVEIECN